MKKLLFVLFFVSVLLSPVNVYAGKPTPPPYPNPNTELQSQSVPYPEPGQGLPAPQLPTDFCTVYGQLCAWGWFGWWVATVQGIGFQADMDVITCIGQIGSLYTSCREMFWVKYDPVNDRNFYAAKNIGSECLHYQGAGLFYVIYVYSPYLGYADIRQPNEYAIYCSYLPWTMKQQA